MKKIALALALASSLSTTAFAYPLTAEQKKFVLIATSAMVTEQNCDYEIIPGTVGRFGDQLGVKWEDYLLAINAAINVLSPNKLYDRDQLIPEVTREVSETFLAYSAALKEDKRKFCKNMGDTLGGGSAPFIRLKAK